MQLLRMVKICCFILLRRAQLFNLTISADFVSLISAQCRIIQTGAILQLYAIIKAVSLH